VKQPDQKTLRGLEFKQRKQIKLTRKQDCQLQV